MFRPLFLIFFLFWNFQIYAQIRSGEIEYAIEIEELPEVKPGENKDVIQKMYKMSKDYVAQMKAVLKFDRSKALFKLEEVMEIDRKPYYRFSKALVGLDKVYLIEADANKLVIQQEDFMTMHLVKDKTKGAGEWEVSSASKIIDGFRVFKASTTEVTENSKGKFEHEVIAWFAPELSFGYGPFGYGGLPGLILELQINRSYLPMTYKLKSIKFSNKALEIQALEGKEISREALDALYREAAANMLKSR